MTSNTPVGSVHSISTLKSEKRPLASAANLDRPGSLEKSKAVGWRITLSILTFTSPFGVKPWPAREKASPPSGCGKRALVIVIDIGVGGEGGHWLSKNADVTKNVRHSIVFMVQSSFRGSAVKGSCEEWKSTTNPDLKLLFVDGFLRCLGGIRRDGE